MATIEDDRAALAAIKRAAAISDCDRDGSQFVVTVFFDSLDDARKFVDAFRALNE